MGSTIREAEVHLSNGMVVRQPHCLRELTRGIKSTALAIVGSPWDSSGRRRLSLLTVSLANPGYPKAATVAQMGLLKRIKARKRPYNKSEIVSI